PVPGCLKHGEGVCVSSCAIERKHQLTEQSLPQRMLVDEPLEFGHELGARAHRELCVNQIFARREPLRLQPTRFAMCERLVENIRQCRPGPKGLRLTQQSSRALDVTREGRATGLLYERLEPVEVELVRTDCEHVPARPA